MSITGKQYTKYLKHYDKKHGTKGGMLKQGKSLKKKRITANYGKYKNIPLTDREAKGGGIFDNYKTKY